MGICTHYIHGYTKKKDLSRQFFQKLFYALVTKKGPRQLVPRTLKDLDDQSSGLSKVTPPTRTLTAATLSPLVASTLVMMASWTFFATSGMVPP